MKITNIETYETHVYTIIDETTNREYSVTKHSSWIDPISPEYYIIDEDNDEVENKELIDKLIASIEESK
jgi:hypothetical protein